MQQQTAPLLRVHSFNSLSEKAVSTPQPIPAALYGSLPPLIPSLMVMVMLLLRLGVPSKVCVGV